MSGLVVDDLTERYPSYDMFGYKITPMTVADQLELVTRHVETRQPCVISPLNMHGLHMLNQEPAMLELHRARKTYVVIDGMPLVALCRLAGIKVRRHHRVTNLDLIWPLLSLAEAKGWRIYYVGSTQDVNIRGLGVIRSRFPKLQMRVHEGFIGVDCPNVIADITQFGADLVMVGMGTGLQERWIYMNMASIGAAIFMPVGALMEYVAGAVKTPPRWMGRLGVEWLFRLLENPRRFWRRYLIEPWLVAWTMLRKSAQNRRLFG